MQGPAPDLDDLDPNVKQMIMQGSQAPPIESAVRHLLDDEDEEREQTMVNNMMKDIDEFNMISARDDEKLSVGAAGNSLNDISVEDVKDEDVADIERMMMR